MKSFVSQKDKEDIESKQLAKKLRNKSELEMIKGIFNNDEVSYDLHPLVKCD